MPRLCSAVLMMALAVAPAQAQQATDRPLNETEQLGRRLFTQSCGVCHLKPQITATAFGPMLSKDSLSGDADALKIVISDGTPRMPGFKHHFTPAEIGAIAAYIKTLPQHAPAAAK